MSLHIQDPNNPLSDYMLESLLEAADGADKGGGAFAFASAEGVRLFVEDETFKQLTSAASFDLVVGVDAVTNLKALKALDTARTSSPGLSVKAFLSDKRRTLFHPKFCWFKKGSAGILITGSGNLTGGGLRWNVEAFTKITLTSAELFQVESNWNAFNANNVPRLHDISNALIQEKAAANAIIQKAAITESKKAKINLPVSALTEAEVEVSEEEASATIPDLADQVLIAEIPKAGSRWNQANFDLNTFTTFFGATPGHHQRIFLYNVSETGELGKPEIRPSVSVVSQNYRFELEAAAGLPYPARGRPIGVFVRVATRTFIYKLLMPNDAGYEVVDSYLASISTALPGRMRREIVSVASLKRKWPKSPLWKKM